MVFELVGSRLLAPTVGTSIYAWTSLIGVILASLSLGYYFGGRIADTRPHRAILALIISFASIAVAGTGLMKDIVSVGVVMLPVVMEVKAVLLSLVLFAPASFFLGMVSPFAVRLSMSDIGKSGRIAGNLYALSTAGSIFGTFLAGFYIIPNIGSMKTVFLLSFALIIVVIALLGRSVFNSKQVIALSFAIIFFNGSYFAVSVATKNEQQNGRIYVDTQYGHAWVFSGTDPKSKKPITALATDPYGTQAARFSDGTEDLVFDYTKFYRIVGHFQPVIQNALMIGGSAYTYPRDFLSHYPDASIDVVEIDPGMTKLAQDYFGLTSDSRLSIIHEDGRLFLNNSKKVYDALFIDAFNSATTIPFQLTTIEAVRAVYDRTRDGGVVLVNIVSSIEGDRGMFLRAEYATYKKVFPQVYVFAVNHPYEGTINQNIMLIALKSDVVPSFSSNNEHYQEQLSHVWTKPVVDDMPILSDDFAPVEYYRRETM
jgi:spermidine synthase